jgi:predicted  nucleic acid-binding Zn ribbon protein
MMTLLLLLLSTHHLRILIVLPEHEPIHLLMVNDKLSNSLLQALKAGVWQSAASLVADVVLLAQPSQQDGKISERDVGV